MPSERKRVVFVDDDPGFLEIVQTLMAHYAQGGWDVFGAPDTAKALALIQEKQPDLIVVDVHMPVVDGVQFLNLLQRKYPDIVKVVLTGDASESYRVACLNNGAALFIQKPATPEGWQKVYSALNELTRLQPEEGFRGVLRRVGLTDVLQMECLARHSLVLAISTGSVQGTIFLQEGQIVHAEAGGRTGEEAFNYLLALKGGEFNLLPFTEPPARTITGAWEFLIMEAARKRDENAGSLPDLSVPLPETAAPLTSPAAEAKLAIPPIGAAAAAPGSLKPQIDEVVICSPQGDVLYAWECADLNGRIGVLEFISQRARQIGQGLPLGNFERLEAHDNSLSRMVAQIQSERAMLVRSSQVAADSLPAA
jgi:CheY-like chemotaxis protein